MEKQKVTYTVVDPNKAGTVEAMLRRILVEKLIAGNIQGK